MTAVIPELLHPAVLAAAKPKSSGSSLFFVFLLVIAVAAYFLYLRPKQQQARRQRSAQTDIHEGDEVVTVGGIVGRVLEMEQDRVHLLTGYHSTVGATEHLPHRMTFVRSAISKKVEPPTSEPVTNGSGAVDDFSFEHDDADEPALGSGEDASDGLADVDPGDDLADGIAGDVAADGPDDAADRPSRRTNANGTAGRRARKSRGRGARGGTGP